MKKATVTLDLSKKQIVDLILEVDDAIVNNNDEDVPQLRKLFKLLNKVADVEFPETKNPPECHD